MESLRHLRATIWLTMCVPEFQERIRPVPTPQVDEDARKRA